MPCGSAATRSNRSGCAVLSRRSSSGCGGAGRTARRPRRASRARPGTARGRSRSKRACFAVAGRVAEGEQLAGLHRRDEHLPVLRAHRDAPRHDAVLAGDGLRPRVGDRLVAGPFERALRVVGERQRRVRPRRRRLRGGQVGASPTTGSTPPDGPRVRERAAASRASLTNRSVSSTSTVSFSNCELPAEPDAVRRGGRSRGA